MEKGTPVAQGDGVVLKSSATLNEAYLAKCQYYSGDHMTLVHEPDKIQWNF